MTTERKKERQERCLPKAHGVSEEVATFAQFPVRKSMKGEHQQLSPGFLAEAGIYTAVNYSRIGSSENSLEYSFLHEAPGLC